MDIGIREVGGVELAVSVEARHGMFTLRTEDGTTIARADTLDKAIAQARPKLAARKVKVEVPFITKAGEKGVATGIHANNGRILARLDGRATQLDHKEQRVLDTTIPKDKLDRYLKLDEEIRWRARERQAIEKEYEIQLASIVRREIEAKAKEVVDAQA